MQLGAGAKARRAASRPIGIGTADVIRDALHEHLNDSTIPIHAAVLQPSTFYHIGTMKEYLQYYSGGIPELDCAPRIYNAHIRLPDKRSGCNSGGFSASFGGGYEQRRISTTMGKAGLPMQEFEGAAVMQCLLPEPGSISINRGSVVEYSNVFPHVTIGSDCIVSNTIVSSSVPQGTFVQTMAVRVVSPTGGDDGEVMYVTHIFDLFKDDLLAQSLNEMTFCGVILPIARERLGLAFLDVWPTAGMEPTMWNAQLFPLAGTAEASFAASLEVYRAVAECRAVNLHQTQRLSLQQSFEMKDIHRDREDRERMRLAIKAHLACDKVISSLERREGTYLGPAFAECVECGHVGLLLQLLDFEASQASQDIGSRALACIASVLSAAPKLSDTEEKKWGGHWKRCIQKLSHGAALETTRKVAISRLAGIREQLPLTMIRELMQTTGGITGIDIPPAAPTTFTPPTSPGRRSFGNFADREDEDRDTDALPRDWEKGLHKGMHHKRVQEAQEQLAHAAFQYELASNVLMISCVSTCFPGGHQKNLCQPAAINQWVEAQVREKREVD
jgi:hypothetical protein